MKASSQRIKPGSQPSPWKIALITLLANLLAALSILFVVEERLRHHHRKTALILAFGVATIASALIVTINSMFRPKNSAPPPNQPPGDESRMKFVEQNVDLENELDRQKDESWMKLVEQNVDLVNDLDRQKAAFDSSGKQLADYVMARLQELLERSGVETIITDRHFDRDRHQPERGGANVSPGALIAETLSPGFAVGRRVLRRARVRLADGSSIEK